MTILPNQADWAGSCSQVPVTGRGRPAAPLTRPFVICSGAELTGTAAGDPNVESYCALPSTAASRYRLDRPDHNQIFHFDLTAEGRTLPAYCLDKFRDGPYGDVPYESAPFESLFPLASDRQKRMLAWLLANTYPTVSAVETFVLAEVDPLSAPVLDGNDAYAAVQVALWVLLGQIAPAEVRFLDCGGDAEHPKSARLRAAVLRLLQLAGLYADARPVVDADAACSCRSPLIQCCPPKTAPADPREPVLRFSGCPSELRFQCGRLLVGPFSVCSDVEGALCVSLEPFCACGGDLSADFADFCGNPIPAPRLGQEFYLALRSCESHVCFTLHASLRGVVTRVVTLRAASTALDYQPIGAALEDCPVELTASLCICVTAPGQAEPGCEPHPGQETHPGIVINNCTSSTSNNRNNNHNNSQNSNHNGDMTDDSIGSGGDVCLPHCFPVWTPDCDGPDGPDFPHPPTPPFPPCPPEQCRPCCPPEPPCSCCPPEPPRPCPPLRPCPPPCTCEPPCICPGCSPEPPCGPDPGPKPSPCYLPIERRARVCCPRDCR